MSKIGLVTPTLNSIRYILQTINSVTVCKNLSYAIIDSGSIDGTLKVASRNNVKVYYFPPGNIYKAINFGLRKFKLNWLTYINSDDAIISGNMIDSLKNNEINADIIYGDTIFISKNGNIVDYRIPPSEEKIGFFLASGIMPFSQPGTLFKREIFEELNGFNTEYKYSADYDFFLRASLSGKKFRYSKNLAHAIFRRHEDQMSKVHYKKMALECKKILFNSGCAFNICKYSYARFLFFCINISQIYIRYKKIKSISRIEELRCVD
jgi:glycosyltransferase involved in cell wall biosynthesis